MEVIFVDFEMEVVLLNSDILIYIYVLIINIVYYNALSSGHLCLSLSVCYSETPLYVCIHITYIV